MYKLLIVDDEEIIRFSFKKLFNWTKYNIDLVHECSNGKEALDYLTNNEVDILITDIKMPIMDGISLLKELNFRKILPKAIIILSAFNEYDLIRNSFKLSADDYILKSNYDEDEILKVINNVISKKFKKEEKAKEISSHEIRLVTEYLKKNYHQNISLKYLSEKFSYNDSYLSHLISKELGVTFVEYLNNIRVTRAKELLETTNLKIYEISTNVGFQSVEHFSRSFKRIAGKSPKEFRQLTSDRLQLTRDI